MKKQYSLYIIDDHLMFSEGLKKILETNEYYRVLKIFSNPLDILEALNFKQPDIIISDISMPKMNGIALAKIVKQKFPHVKFLILSMYNTFNHLKDAIDAKVDGYIPKDSRVDEVYNAIRMIINGESYISPSISANFIKSRLNDIELTQREIEVLKSISMGLNTQQIADKLFISPHTVETHRKNLLTKTGCCNSVELSMWGVKKGYINTEDLE